MDAIYFPMVQRMMELYATGEYTITTLRKQPD
jgi:hypothetical protein